MTATRTQFGRKDSGKPQDHKVLPVFITKVDQEQGVVDAIVSVFGVVDYGSDRILPGAFRKTIVERSRKIRVLDQHNTDSILRVIGKPLEVREVGREELPAEVLERYPEATGGLLTSTQYLLNTPEGRGAFDRIAAGAVDEYSIGYDALSVGYSELERDGKKLRVRDLKEIRLWEYSPVIWGMNPATATVAAKDSEGTPEDPKEITPDGPIQRLGDTLHACLIQSCDYFLTSLYKEGVLDYDGYNTVKNVVHGHLMQVHEEIPEDLGLMPISHYFYYSMLSLPAADLEGKEGRVLSAARAARLQEMIDTLSELLEEAGYGFDEDEEEGKQQVPPAATAGSQLLSSTDAGTEAPTDKGARREELMARATRIDRRLNLMEQSHA